MRRPIVQAILAGHESGRRGFPLSYGNSFMDLLHFLQVLLLAIVQGAAELLPVSSSAHVIVAARLLGYQWQNDFERAFFLVMLHSGTMLAVLLYFWPRWKLMVKDIPALVVATACTGLLGLPLILVIEKATHQDVEHLFQNLPLIACSLAAAGLLIIVAGRNDAVADQSAGQFNPKQGAIVGLVQGIALPFRGFSRSGSTISAGMLLGVARSRAEEFSFALAVIITPAVIAREGWKLWKFHSESAGSTGLGQLILPGLVGMAVSFAAGLLALRWLSSWLEKGRWKFFGFYCLAAAAAVIAIHLSGIGGE